MKVAYLTAGAGGMYCGSCMRDNTLAAALIRKKRDVTLIPVYSPIRVDEPDVSTDRVYYGGINVFLQQKSALFRHAPRLLDRLLDSPRLLERAMRRAGSARTEELGPLTLSILRGEEGAQRRELEKLIEGLGPLRPDVVHLPNAMFVGLARSLREALDAAVVCSLTGEDIFLESLPSPHREEAYELIRRAAGDVHGFFSVTRYYGEYARRRFGVSEDRLYAVPMGIRVDDIPPAPANRGGAGPFTLGYLARVCPEKGLHLLCEAFIRLHDRGLRPRLKIAGYVPEGSREYLEEIRSCLSERGLDDFVDWLGEVDRAGKLAMLGSCDVFSVPTVYREAKGIYVLEALAHGVPVVQPAHGSFPELIGATGGGVLFEPCDAGELADVIERLMGDEAERRRLGAEGLRAVREHFTDERMAEAAWDAFERIAARAGTRVG